jgi:hypothetical protein
MGIRTEQPPSREVTEALDRLRAALALICARYLHPINGSACICGARRVSEPS